MAQNVATTATATPSRLNDQWMICNDISVRNLSGGAPSVSAHWSLAAIRHPAIYVTNIGIMSKQATNSSHVFI